VRSRQSDPWKSKIFYGQLERTLLCVLPNHQIFGKIEGKTRLLAVITPCTHTQGKDASKEITNYRHLGTRLVTDLQSVVGVVGRMQTRGSWAVVDRTGGFIRPEFVSDNEGVDADSEE
jgi:hypothetical protein